MALDPDPYRILELPPGATLDEVKRAYRRLAKVHHPDAAGEAALPRFLAIQAAYEQLLTGASPGARGRRAPGGPRRAWEADPDRSDATRRAYGGRARSAPAGGATPGGGARPRPSGPPGEGGGTRSEGPAGAGSSHGPSGPAGSAGTAGPAANGAGAGSDGAASGTGPAGAAGSGSRGPTSGRSRRRRTTGDGSGPDQATPPNPDAGRSRRTKRNKATLGSTSYDGADGPFEPDWRGASWYGTTSGTYWTLNPKEYADPRKHGPEYQARARRAVRSRAPEVGATDAAAAGPAGPAGSTGAAPPEDVGPEAPGQAPGPGGRPVSEPMADPAAGPTHTTSSWWDSTTGPAAAPSGSGLSAADRFATETGPLADDRHRASAVQPAPDIGRAAEDIIRALTDERLGGVRGRVARAVIGWLPIAFGIGWIVGELTGCGRFAATCDGSADPLVLIIQVAVLAVLLVVPVLASIATMAALALFAAAIVAALILSATGSAADGDSRRAALGAVLLVAWFVGVAIAVVRRFRTMSSPTRPVS
jgi:curved DNA-binding protein CbpA